MGQDMKKNDFFNIVTLYQKSYFNDVDLPP